MKLKYGLRSLWLAWKTRRLINSQKILSLKSQVKDLEEFYVVKPGSRPNNHILKARESYSLALLNMINNPHWFKSTKGDQGIEAKKKRVQQMREKNQRLRENNDFSPKKGINPDERPIKGGQTYGFNNPDDRPIGGSGAKAPNPFGDPDERPIGGGALPMGAGAPSGGTDMMTFDFSDNKPKAPTKKREFLKKKSGQKKPVKKSPPKKPVEQHIEETFGQEPSVQSSVSPKKKPPASVQKSQNPKKKFLKRGQGQKYDPLKAVKEARDKKKRQRQQEQEELEKAELEQVAQIEAEKSKKVGGLTSEPISLINDDEDELVNIMSVNDNKSLGRRKTSNEESVRLTRAIKEKVEEESRSSGKQGKSPSVSNQFQDLKYLKKIPKRVD